jgi:membrane protease YdiL (CAAX protease family)
MEQTLPLPIAIVLYAFGGVSLAVGLGLVWRVARGETLVPYEDRRPAPWRAGHIALVLLYLLVPLALEHAEKLLVALEGAASGESLQPDELSGALVFMSLSSLLVVGATAAVCRILAGATWADLGWRPGTVAADVRLGIVAFVALAAPLYLLQWWLTRHFPSEHPVVELLNARRDPAIVALCAISAVVVAPITEEWMFRLFFQGWLEALAGLGDENPPAHTLPAGGQPPVPMPPDTPTSSIFAGSPCQASPTAAAPAAAGGERTALRLMPIAASSLLFAALHQWPDQAPLFVLALVLGYLYQRTHRILPCIVLHACLNLTSLTLFLLADAV